MREPDVDRERDAAPAAPAQLTVMSSGSAARPGPEGPSGIVRVEPETRSERVGVRSWASELPAARARNPDFLGPESRKSGSGFRERNPGPPARADRKPRLRGGAPSRKPGAKARPRRSGFRHRTSARVTLAPPVTSTACPSYRPGFERFGRERVSWAPYGTLFTSEPPALDRTGFLVRRGRSRSGTVAYLPEPP